MGQAGHPQDLPLREQARLVAAAELDPVELLDATIARIAERNGGLRAVAETFAEESHAMLRTAPKGPLYGVPVTVKDMFALPWRGYRNGTRQELGRPAESGVFRQLRKAGAVVVGVDNQHELGLGTTGTVSAYGPAANPWNAERCAGGSSGGSAAAVAARFVAGSIGSDTAGSTRLPAGWCGVVGVKATYGAVSYAGYTGSNSSFSAPGVFARDAADARLVLEALLGRPLGAAGEGELRVGVVADPYWTDIDPLVEQACREALEIAGFRLVSLELPLAELAMAAGTVRVGAEVGVAVPGRLLPELQATSRGMLAYWALHSARRLVRADRVRGRLREQLAEAFESCDLLAWPTNPAPAPPIADPVLRLPSGEAPTDPANMRQAILANLTGVPGISLPVGLHDDGMPIGLQLLAPWGEESLLFTAARRFEEATDGRWIDVLPTRA